jgi:alcohol dehydrogenase
MESGKSKKCSLHNQVLIIIHASGICYTDVHITRGALGVKFPHTVGHEPAGEIVALGEDVKTRKVGDRVGVLWLQSARGRCEWCQRDKSFFVLLVRNWH